MGACRTQIDIGDEGPYQGLVEALWELCRAVQPRNVPSPKKRRARALKSILKGVYTRIKECARQKLRGTAHLLQSEIAGHGGLSIFRRLDAACIAGGKTENKPEYQSSHSGSSGGGGAGRGARARGQWPRGRGGARRDLADLTCFNCYQRGHLRRDCPAVQAEVPAANNP